VFAVVATFLIARIFSVENGEDSLAAAPAVRVSVIAYQWGWEFDYPGTPIRIVGETAARAAGNERLARNASFIVAAGSSHRDPCGRRYLTRRSRCGPVTRLLDAEPFGQSRPREMGLSGSPSICTTRFPLLYTSWPQPTAQ
jgi:heme/copper-type cytochrome/quinol oxidase subunit 2